jgi:hypothetical protein
MVVMGDQCHRSTTESRQKHGRVRRQPNPEVAASCERTSSADMSDASSGFGHPTCDRYVVAEANSMTAVRGDTR